LKRFLPPAFRNLEVRELQGVLATRLGKEQKLQSTSFLTEK
jgi:hypothetical protein